MYSKGKYSQWRYLQKTAGNVTKPRESRSFRSNKVRLHPDLYTDTVIRYSLLEHLYRTCGFVELILLCTYSKWLSTQCVREASRHQWSVSSSCDRDDTSPDNRLEWFAEDRETDASKSLPRDDEGNRSFKLTSDDDTVSFSGATCESIVRSCRSESLSDVEMFLSPLHNTASLDSCFPVNTTNANTPNSTVDLYLYQS